MFSTGHHIVKILKSIEFNHLLWEIRGFWPHKTQDLRIFGDLGGFWPHKTQDLRIFGDLGGFWPHKRFGRYIFYLDIANHMTGRFSFAEPCLFEYDLEGVDWMVKDVFVTLEMIAVQILSVGKSAGKRGCAKTAGIAENGGLNVMVIGYPVDSG